jgi:16S rRNA C967 or C1407 C5-methylase (RsmB/RsmF family)/NOL1/NOP2/fmu family ribosome biogenesis protein
VLIPIIIGIFANMEFPKAFTERMHHQLKEEAADFFRALKTKSPVSIRLNRQKPSKVKGKHVPWCSDGIYLESRPSFTLDPLFHAGCYYVQEASSMFLEQVIRSLGLDKKRVLALDACAAPGGKTTHISALLNEESLLVANETIASRVQVLKENVIKWGRGNVVVTGSDTSAFSSLMGLFDLIVIDAPCSGEGLFRKDAEAADEWSEESCALCAGRQKRILSNLLPTLKKDGILIYCTCTYNAEENEKNVEWLCGNHEMQCLSIPLSPEWSIKEENNNGVISYSFYPHQLQGEGFFISVLQKKSRETAKAIKKSSTQFVPLPSSFSGIKDWIKKDTKLEFFKRNDDIHLLHPEWLNLIEMLSKNLRIHYAGTEIGRIKRDDIIPSHSLAMSVYLNRETFPELELSLDDALRYLRKNDFPISNSQKGWMVVTFEGHPLGWINNLGNRFNNYYPTEWRIRMR